MVPPQGSSSSRGPSFSRAAPTMVLLLPSCSTSGFLINHLLTASTWL
jgi:hypothetical protein